jgi:hypothetical protein
MKTVTSRDGTTIAFDRSGQGPAPLLVGGTLEHRALEGQGHEVSPQALAPVLIEFFKGSEKSEPGRSSRRKAIAKEK